MTDNQEQQAGSGNVNIDATVANMELAKAPEPARTPSGDYNLQITSWSVGESAKKKTPFVRFGFKIAGVRQILSGQDLPEGFNDQELLGRDLEYDFYLTEKSVFRLKNFCESVGFDMGNQTVGALLQTRAFDALVGSTVVGCIRPETYSDKETGEQKTAHRLDDFAKA